jgi:hypothetical protein
MGEGGRAGKSGVERRGEEGREGNWGMGVGYSYECGRENDWKRRMGRGESEGKGAGEDEGEGGDEDED